MDVSSVMAGITSLSVEDRLQLVNAILESIDRDEPQDALSDAQKKEIDRRLAELDASPSDVMTREEIRAKIQTR
jgi:putative addiction module component (TIGR02574 family)